MDLSGDTVLVAAGVTRREAEVLAAIGMRMTNREIAEAWTVSVRTVESHVAALRRKLHVHDRVGLRAAAMTAATRAAVPPATTSLVGRDTLLQATVAALARSRFVTLVGPGGAGKTRLAHEVARRQAGEVRLVDLTRSDGPVRPAVLTALGIAPDATHAPRGLLRLVLDGRGLLVVLDDADRSLTEVAATAADLLCSTSDLRVLVTSRERLARPDEQVVEVAPLSLPAGDTAAEVAASDAAQLLVARARGAGRRLRIDDETASAIARVCRRVDGLPLGLELAAAALATQPLHDLAAALDQGMPLPRQPGRRPRHATMRDAVAWSWSRLEPAEQALLSRLAVLPDGITRPELLDLDHLAAPPVGDLVTSLRRLVECSLVVLRSDGVAGTAHWRLLETVREAARALGDPTDQRRTMASAAAMTLDRLRSVLARTRDGEVVGADGHERRGSLAALRWAAEHDPACGSELLAAIGRRYELDPTAELLHGVRDVLETRALPDGWPTPGLAWGGLLLNYLDVELLCRAAEAAAARSTSPDEQALADVALGYACAYGERGAQARSALDRAHRHWTRAGDGVMVGHVLMARGLAAPDAATAVEMYERSMLAFLRAKAYWNANCARLMLVRRAIGVGVRRSEIPAWLEASRRFANVHNLGHDASHAVAAAAELALADGAREQADSLATQAADAFRRLGDLRCLARAARCRAAAADDAARRSGHLRDALRIAMAQADPIGLVTTLQAMADAAHAAGRPAQAARAQGAAARVAGRGLDAVDADDEPWAAFLREGHAGGPTLLLESFI